MTVVTTALEIAVASPAGARAALEGGADRVELCVGLELGGLTPSQGLIEAVALGGLPAHVLIRPRPGDFAFDSDDVALMERETRAAVSSGAAGVVIGALTATGELDVAVVERLVAAAHSTRAGATVTFHRAIDQAVDPVALVRALAGLGVDRVLTSGSASRAIDGATTLARVVEAAGSVEVMAGGGVSPADIPALVELGVDAVHLSAKRPAARRGGRWVSLGAAAAEPDTYFETDPTVVRAARLALSVAPRA
ncbi:MAG: copper homeostasis protein CutC [Frondihabitans sp.]|nr:copper homeostasis protein CutC [Frondihabitans sp.]